MDSTFTFKLNGQQQSVSTDADRPLLEVLREDFHLLGTRYGCGEGECGACTVLVNGKHTLACLTPIAEVDKKEIQTIEGLAEDGKLHPVQAAFLAENAFQCGTCTSGMIMATVALLKQTPTPTDADIHARMQGHLCRCCGYPKIVKAVQRAAQTKS